MNSFRRIAFAFFGLTVLEATATQYGKNYAPVRRDNESVAANFPDVPGIELLSPAFMQPDGIQAGFENGTNGPTNDAELGIGETIRA